MNYLQNALRAILFLPFIVCAAVLWYGFFFALWLGRTIGSPFMDWLFKWPPLTGKA